MLSPTARMHPRPIVILGIAACALAAVLALVRTGAVGASGDTVLALVPAGETRAGKLITLKLVASSASDLAGFQSTVQFDGGALRLTGASVEADLGRGGRGLIPLGPVMGEGSVALGAATCPIPDCDAAPGQPAARVESGVSGKVELGTLEFYSETPGSYQLSLDRVLLVDPQGNQLPVRVEPMVLEVRP